MKILLKSANTNDILNCFNSGLVDGVDVDLPIYTDKGIGPLSQFYDNLTSLVVRELHVPLRGDYETMAANADTLIKRYGDSITLKIPVTFDGLRLCKELTAFGHRVNMVMVYNPSQAVMAAKAGATNITVQVGEIDDLGYAGLEVLRSVASMNRSLGVATEVVGNDLRTTHRVVRALYNGASTVVLEPKVFRDMTKHVLTEAQLDASKGMIDLNEFLADDNLVGG